MRHPSLLSLSATAAGALAVVFTAAAPTTASAASGTVIIGQEVCQTGYLAASDAYLVSGAQIAVNLLNAKGGILGHKVTLVTKDTQCVASNEIQLGNALISQSHANAIIGGYQSAAIQGLLPVVQSHSVPFIGGGTLPLESAWGVTTFPSNSYVPQTILNYLTRNLGAKTIGNITGDTPFGKAVQTLVDSAAKAAKVKTIDTQIADAATTTTPVLQQMSGADAIFSNTSGPINIIFAKDAATLGLSKPLIFQDARSTCEQAGAAYPHVYCVVPQASVYPDISNPKVKANMAALYRQFLKKGGSLANFGGVTAGADQVNLLAQAMTKAKSTDGSAVNKALSSLSYTGAQAVYKFTPGHTFGIVKNPYVLTKATSSSLKVVSAQGSKA